MGVGELLSTDSKAVKSSPKSLFAKRFLKTPRTQSPLVYVGVDPVTLHLAYMEGEAFSRQTAAEQSFLRAAMQKE